jgi:hypothetical protein
VFGGGEKPGGAARIGSGRPQALLNHLAANGFLCRPGDRGTRDCGDTGCRGQHRSIVTTSRPASERKLSCRISSALRRARSARLSGRSCRPGMTAPSTKIGTTRTSRARAASISSRTKWSGSSSRRLPPRWWPCRRKGPKTWRKHRAHPCPLGGRHRPGTYPAHARALYFWSSQIEIIGSRPPIPTRQHPASLQQPRYDQASGAYIKHSVSPRAIT